MKLWKACVAAAAAASFMATLCAARRADDVNKLIVHEWGTFLAMSGSDGATLDGMYHEEHALPSFVHARSRDQLHMHTASIKGETPVIYFYTGREREVRVRVDFPGGIWTQWYPQANLVGPALAQTGTPPAPRNGHIFWIAYLTPPEGKTPQIVAAPKDALWNFARDVDSAYVRTNDETRAGMWEADRFLFYRGLGRVDLPVQFSSASGGSVTCSGSLPEGIRHLYVIRVENGYASYVYRDALDAGETADGLLPQLDHAEKVDACARRLADDMAGKLERSGLYAKEARAMVNTWTNSYFKSDGIRALFVLPQHWTERFIPIHIDPAPHEMVRVMVGRIELLTPEREKRIESAVRELASPDTATRQRAFETLREQGRYAEPILNRVAHTTKDTTVRTLCKRLLLSGYVTELRSALNNAADGRKVIHRQLDVRAQLASLLREVGLNSEAKAEGEAVRNALHHTVQPPMTRHDSRFYLRSAARASEGVGDELGALDWYGKFVQFGSQALGKCQGCHDMEGPRNASFFRDWWAGRRYAEFARRTGQTESLIRTNRAIITEKPKDSEARLKLAYLHESRGERAEAAHLWAQIDPAGESRKVAVVGK